MYKVACIFSTHDDGLTHFFNGFKIALVEVGYRGQIQPMG